MEMRFVLGSLRSRATLRSVRLAVWLLSVVAAPQVLSVTVSRARAAPPDEATVRTAEAAASTPQAEPASAPPTRPLRWYGYQTLLVDAVWAGIAIASERYEPLLAYPLTGPIVHVIHAQYGRAALSLGVRLALPPLSGAISAATRGDCEYHSAEGGPEPDYGCAYAPLAWMVGGGVVAILVDALALSYARPTISARAQARLVPYLVANQRFQGILLSGVLR